MDAKTITILEYPKILRRLSDQCAFSASKEMALALQPANSLDVARAQLEETSEARHLLSVHDVGVGGARDVREHVTLTTRGGVLEPASLLEVKATLIASREMRKSLEKKSDRYPRIVALSQNLASPQGLVESITRTISERGEVLDSASRTLSSIRAQMRVAHDRLMSRLQKYITDSKTVPMLQESLVTQRDGRYVIPLRAEFKGRIKSIVHDQSSSGATLFVEPLPVVELNNAFRELQLAERDEERRVLAELCLQIALAADEIINGVNALAELDLIFAKAKYAEGMDASAPILRETQDEKLIHLIRARHPLLDPKTVVPIDFDPEPGTLSVVITGPNTGGKTVTLKTVGLFVLMAQSGLHIPAESGSILPLFKSVYADIGDEQSIEQSLSTFSGHMTNIVDILKKASPDTLVIFDELGAGTDPQEGAALARAILTYLLDNNIPSLIATHYPELKAFAHTTARVVNASLEFDIRTLRPTYHLTIGLPGRSNALAIAERLGLPDQIIALAKQEINPAELRVDDLLDSIRKQRNLAFKERRKAEKARSESHKMRRELSQKLETIEDERLTILEQAREESSAQIEALQAELKNLRRELQKARQPLDALKPMIEQVEAIEQKVQKPVRKRTSAQEEISQGPPRLGEKIILRSLNKEGVVTALGEDDLEIQIGLLRVRARHGDVLRKGEAQPAAAPEPVANAPKRKAKAAKAEIYHPSPGMELDLRGQRADDALDALDRYIEQAYLAGLPFVRIIHGKGTGKLRESVRDVLKSHAHIRSFEEGQPKEGGEGVTVATLYAE